MHPILIDLGARSIGSYGVMVALGVAVSGFAAVRAAHRARLDVGLTLAALACVVAGGFAGAWIAFGLVEVARTGSLSWLAHGGGAVFFGAVPGGALAAAAAGRWLRLDWLRVLDLSVPGLAAGHALGRIGCLLGGCCYGRPGGGAWAVLYTHPIAPGAHPSVPRHPAPLYEAVGLLALGAAFALIPPRRAGDGSRALAYLAAYAALRVAVEAFRGDAIRGVWLGASTSQIVAVVALLGAAALLARGRLADRPARD